MPVFINFIHPVVPQTTAVLMAAISKEIQKPDCDGIYLMLSTPGGNVREGVAIYNFLRGLPVKVTTHNMGNVDSIGNAIFLAGEDRYAAPHTTFMFHGVGFNIERNERLEAKMLRERMDSLKADEKRIADIISNRTSIEPKKAQKLFYEASTKTPEWALDNGIIQEVRELSLPRGQPVLSFVFQG